MKLWTVPITSIHAQVRGRSELAPRPCSAGRAFTQPVVEGNPTADSRASAEGEGCCWRPCSAQPVPSQRLPTVSGVSREAPSTWRAARRLPKGTSGASPFWVSCPIAEDDSLLRDLRLGNVMNSTGTVIQDRKVTRWRFITLVSSAGTGRKGRKPRGVQPPHKRPARATAAAASRNIPSSWLQLLQMLLDRAGTETTCPAAAGIDSGTANSTVLFQ